jgi:hypothetical protein
MIESRGRVAALAPDYNAVVLRCCPLPEAGRAGYR